LEKGCGEEFDVWIIWLWEKQYASTIMMTTIALRSCLELSVDSLASHPVSDLECT
jgi:hypothetical protein